MARTIRWWSAGLDDVPADERWVDEAEAVRFASMRFTKRRDEARLARWTAKATVARARGMGLDPASLAGVTVRNAADGAPELWIHGEAADAVIAMTDRADWAVTAILDGTDRIGCDLELVEPRSPAFVADYLTDEEQRRVEAADDPALAANLVWSAKESALKVLRTGLRRPTRSVEVAFDDGGDGWAPLAVRDADGDTMHGWWVRHGDFVLTVAATVETVPPVSLEDPPPLATATPSHRWLEDPWRP